MELRGSKTEKNLLGAFAGESQARNRYTYFASAAKKEGYEQISKIFEETSNQEKEHAKRFLKAAAAGEHEEWSGLYPSFAKTAREEGFEDIAKTFEAILIAEKQHEKRYLDLAKNIENGKVFKKDQPVKWRCLNCGYVHEGTEALDSCPACIHPKAYFEVLGENW
jgi:rubrerythrin